MTAPVAPGFKAYAGLALLAAVVSVVFALTFLGAKQIPLKTVTFVQTATIAWVALLVVVALARAIARR